MRVATTSTGTVPVFGVLGPRRAATGVHPALTTTHNHCVNGCPLPPVPGRFVDLLGKLIGVAKFVQNFPPKNVPQESKVVMAALRCRPRHVPALPSLLPMLLFATLPDAADAGARGLRFMCERDSKRSG